MGPWTHCTPAKGGLKSERRSGFFKLPKMNAKNYPGIAQWVRQLQKINFGSWNFLSQQILWALNNHMRLLKVIYQALKGCKTNYELPRLQ